MWLLAVVIGHVVLISLQVSAPSGTGLFEGFTVGLFSEVQRGVARGVAGVSGFWHGYVELRSVQAENDELRESVAALRFEVQREHALAQRVRGLEALLDLREEVSYTNVIARVIAGDPTVYFRTVMIDRGTGDGVLRDSAVVSPDGGVVGRVVGDPGPRAAKVQLLIDRNAAAGALIERTRAAGVVMGDADQGVLRMEYVSNLLEVEVGDTVVTSGMDSVYPYGFVIGEVEAVHQGPGSSLYKTIQVRPSVMFSDLENVLVIVHEPASSMTAASGR